MTTQPVETVIAVLSSHRGGRVDQRCRRGIGYQLHDCAADRGGCRRAPAPAAAGGRLTGHAIWCDTTDLAPGYLLKGGGPLTAEERSELRLAVVQGHLKVRRVRRRRTG